MNSVNLIGRPTKDPEVRVTTDGMKVASFTLAVDRMKKGEADFIRCKAFGKTADFVESYVTKGGKYALTGRIQTGSYKGQDGRTVYTTDVIAERMEFCESKKKDGFMEVTDDADLPFGG